MRFLWFVLFAVIPLVATPLSACGGNDAPAQQADVDASPADAPVPDATAQPPGDAGAEGACPPGDAGAAPPAPAMSLIAADPNALPQGITTDNQVVYLSNLAVYVAPLDGSAQPQLLAPAADGGVMSAFASGRSVFLFDNYYGGWSNDGGELSVWSKDHGMRALASSNVAAGSDDGAWIAYAVMDSSMTAHLVVEAPDGSSSTTVASGILVESCQLVLQFAGDTLVAQYCDASNVPDGADAAADAGTATSATLAAFAPPSFAQTILAGQAQLAAFGGVNAQPMWTIDPTGARVWVPLANPPQNGELIALASPGVPAVVDTGARVGVFSPPGDALYYVKSGGALKRVAASAPSSPVVVANSANSVLDVSPDGQYAAYSTAAFSPYDLDLASAAAPGAPVVENRAKQVVNFARMFTVDSQFLIYRVDTYSNPNFNSTIEFVPVSCGAPAVLSANRAYDAHPMYGSVVVVADDSEVVGVNDLSLYDLRAPTLKTTFAMGASSSVVFPRDGKTIVFSSPSQVGAGVGPGLIRATLP